MTFKDATQIEYNVAFSDSIVVSARVFLSGRRVTLYVPGQGGDVITDRVYTNVDTYPDSSPDTQYLQLILSVYTEYILDAKEKEVAAWKRHYEGVYEKDRS